MSGEETRARAVLWDLDGTLLDSSDHHWQAWVDTLARVGRTITRAQYEATFGLRNEETVPVLLGAEVARAEGLALAHQKEERYRTLVRERGVALLPGVAGWLERLRAAGWRQALATSTPGVNVAAIFAATGLDRRLDAWVDGDQVKNGKPDPEIFLLAAQRVGVPPARCVVVEDAPAGIAAARRAGMPCVAVRSSHRDLAGDATVETLAELPADAFDRLLESR